MRWLTKFPWRFTRKQANGSTATRSMPIETDTPLCKWYQNITDLPLSKYIECVVDNNLSALIISGYPTKEQLQSAWLEIAEQYAEAMGDAERKMYLKLYKELILLNIEYQQVINLIEVLTIVQYEPFEKKLNELLFTNFAFTDKREKEIETCYRFSKQILVKIEYKNGQLEGMKQHKDETEGRPNREYFQSILITLSDHAKYPVMETISTFEFCERVKRFTQFVEKQKSDKWQKTK
jgi:hypothetical protein